MENTNNNDNKMSDKAKKWNMSTVSGILVLGIPLEEIMFAFGLGFLWSSVYEHITWKKIV